MTFKTRYCKNLNKVTLSRPLPRARPDIFVAHKLLCNRAYGLTLAKLYSRSMPEGNNSRRAKLPQESASLTSAHSLDHE
ncbi:unnamed protein product [Caenorhabditis nigoni]